MVLEHKGTPIFYTDNGEGQPIVLLHGFLENSSIWNPFVPALKKKNRVICIDLLGHGKSGCLGYIHTMEQMAEAVKAILKHLRIQHSYVLGHSMGGYVALAFADKYQNEVRGLCLINSTASADTREKQKNRDRAILAVKENHRTFIRIAISNLFSLKNRSVFSKEINALTLDAQKTPLQGIIAALEGMKIRKNREDVFKNGSFNKMLILGKEDPVLDYKLLVDQTKNTDIEIVLFPDGHMSYIENKEELLQKIMRFIE
ncbi:Pimeloyl-ACP methyl ester carboxylesterase [Hyunsoonleella jejuensis]|uniref:Pimeloyl-ACP methyl ester carboxylesterase n=1 Tax=Hyunsoonleella jejuensis TaxID=419940 RepID=A0A1H9BRC9_9FLAO|nr:alpha/beta hydrolase [Hyunsoonleella jejuensis]SEP91522.1 Pimeloyl-ACP methyl ester carboxylesterase [Hyunsoonleella jejuensis]